MAIYKNDNGTWYVMIRYQDWTGARKQKCKRGFSTRKEAADWELQFKLQKKASVDMTMESFCTLNRKGYYQHNYECSRAHGKTKTVITAKATGNIIFNFEQDGYDIDVLRQQSGFTSLTGRQQEKCEECYKELTPYRNTSVLATGQNTKQIGVYNFVNDAGKISEAIVIILYMLRCCLAHGDISPDESANEVYKYAYEVLCAPLKKLK